MSKIIKEILKSIPEEKISDAVFEGANIVLYTKDKDFFLDNNGLIKNIVDDIKKENDLDEAEKLYDHLKKHGTLRDVRDAQHLDDRKHLKTPQFSGKYPTASELVKQARRLPDIDKKVPSAHELLERKKKQLKK